MAVAWTLRTFVHRVKCLAVRTAGINTRSMNTDVPEIDQSISKGQITSHKSNVGGQTIHYLKTGHGNRLVFLMPGMLGSAKTDFMHQLDGLNKDIFTLIAWDPPGYGQSRPPDRTWPKNWFTRDADVASSFLQVLPREDRAFSGRKFSVLGWSDGGITACVLAARHPDQVERLIIWGAAAYCSDVDAKINEGIRDVKKWSERMRNSYLEMYDMDYLSNHCSQWVDAYNGYMDHSDGELCVKDLPNIKCPTLIMHGQKDALVGQFHPDYLHANITDSKLINYPDGKHNMHMKYHKQFNSQVEQFIISPHNVKSNI